MHIPLQRSKLNKTQASTDRTPCKMKTPPAKNVFPCMSGMSLCPRLDTVWEVFGTSFSGQSRWWNLSLKNLCQHLCYFSLAPCLSVPWPRVWKLWQVLGAQFFGTITLMEFVLKTRANRSASQYVASLPTDLSPSYFPRFPIRPRSKLPSRSLPTELSPSFFPWFPARPPCRRFSLSLPPNGALPKLYPCGSNVGSICWHLR